MRLKQKSAEDSQSSELNEKLAEKNIRTEEIKINQRLGELENLEKTEVADEGTEEGDSKEAYSLEQVMRWEEKIEEILKTRE